jgi:hypothetical protein
MVRHGDVLSTLLFNVRQAKLQTTGPIFNNQKQLIAYVARSLAAVHDALQALEAGAAKVGLKINEQKTKYMIAAGNRTIIDAGQTVAFGDKNFEVVNEGRPSKTEEVRGFEDIARYSNLTWHVRQS